MTDTLPAFAANTSVQAFRWMLGAIVSFSAMAIAGRELAGTLTTFEILAYRSLIGVPILAFFIWRAGGLATISTKQPGQHVKRNIVHFIAQNCWFYAIATIALAQVIALEFTNPIWVLLLAPLLLGERLTKERVFAALIGFAGVLIVAKPGYSPLEWGHVAALAAAIGFALTNIFTKKIAADDGLLCVLFWMTASQTAMGFLIAVPQGLTIPTLAALPWVIVVALAGLTAHLSLTRALMVAPALVVAPMDFLRLPTLATAGALLYGEALEVSVLLGGTIILAGNLVNLVWRKNAKSKP